MVREVCARWGSTAKNAGEKMDRVWREQCGAEASQFAGGANLEESSARLVARAPQEKVAIDPWGSEKAAEAWRRLRLLESFRVFAGGNGVLLLPNFPEWNSFRR